MKTSEEWDAEIQDGIRILDPDGWDRKNFNYSWYKELITKEEFYNRRTLSTVEFTQGRGEKV